MKHDFEIHARRMYDRMGVQLYLYQKLDDGRIRVCELEQTEHGPFLKSTDIGRPEPYVVLDEGSKFKPFIVLDEPLYRELLSAMMRLADNEGVPRPSEDHLKGKLEATQKHLEDVQNMLKFTTAIINRREREREHGPNREPESGGNSVNGLLEQAQ